MMSPLIWLALLGLAQYDNLVGFLDNMRLGLKTKHNLVYA
jgi:hypothetical protein